MTATAPVIITRPAWGANPLITPAGAISLPSEELWLHHTAGEQFDAAGMRMLQAFTLHRTDEHYVDLEYSFVLDHLDCSIFESRGVGRNTAATGGRVRILGLPIGPNHNTISHAICVMGDFTVDEPSDQLLETLANLVAYGFEQGWWPLGFTGGHRDASGNSTACPGNKLEARIPQINARAVAIHQGTPGPTPPPVSKEEPMLVRSNKTNTGADANVWRGVRINVAGQTVVELGGASCNPNPVDFAKPWEPDVDVPDDPVDSHRRFTLVDPTNPARHKTFRVD